MAYSAGTSPGHAVLQRPAWDHEDPPAQASALTASSCWASLCVHARNARPKGIPSFARKHCRPIQFKIECTAPHANFSSGAV